MGKALNDGKSIGPTHTLSVKTHLFTDKLYFEPLVREMPPFYGQTDDWSQSLPEELFR